MPAMTTACHKPANLVAQLLPAAACHSTLTAICWLLWGRNLPLKVVKHAGGSLTSYVADKFQDIDPQGLILSEEESRYYFKQFVSAVAYCHKHCIAHRWAAC